MTGTMVIDRTGNPVGELERQDDQFIEVKLPQGARRWYASVIIAERRDDLVRLGLPLSGLEFYGLSHNPRPIVGSESFIG